MNSERRTPDFLIVGAAKSGTTSLSNYLSAHPSIEVVSNRLEFFGEYRNPATGDLSLEAYLRHFSAVPPGKLCGEKSVSYLYSGQAIADIYELNPDMKILMVLRDPTERAYSDYWQRRRTGVENLSFEDALAQENDRILNGARFELHYANYGLYAGRVSAYVEKFGSENVYVIRYEDLRRQPESVCRGCFGFLGVDENFISQSYPVHNKGSQGKDSAILRLLFWMARQKVIVSILRAGINDGLRKRATNWMARKNATGRYPEIKKETEEQLHTFFEDDINELERVLDWDLSEWKS
jgi:hypothetical protein